LTHHRTTHANRGYRPRRLCTAVPLATLLLTALAGCVTSQSARRPSGAWDETRMEVALQLADEHLAAGKFDDARRTLAAHAESNDLRVALRLARVDLEEGRYRQVLERLPELSPEQQRRATPAQSATFSALRGVAWEGLGHWTEAATNYAAAYQQEPAPDRLAAWVSALVLSGDEDAAADVLESNRSRFPGEPELQILAARLAEGRGEWSAAAHELETACLARPDDRELRAHRAALLMKAARHPEAIPLWRQLVDTSNDASEKQSCRHQLTTCLLAAGRSDEALRLARTMALTSPRDRLAHVDLAVASLASGDPATAFSAGQAALAIDPTCVTARIVTALSCRRLNRPLEAEQQLSAIPESDRAEWVRELLARWSAERSAAAPPGAPN